MSNYSKSVSVVPKSKSKSPMPKSLKSKSPMSKSTKSSLVAWTWFLGELIATN